MRQHRSCQLPATVQQNVQRFSLGGAAHRRRPSWCGCARSAALEAAARRPRYRIRPVSDHPDQASPHRQDQGHPPAPAVLQAGRNANRPLVARCDRPLPPSTDLPKAVCWAAPLAKPRRFRVFSENVCLCALERCRRHRRAAGNPGRRARRRYRAGAECQAPSMC